MNTRDAIEMVVQSQLVKQYANQDAVRSELMAYFASHTYADGLRTIEALSAFTTSNIVFNAHEKYHIGYFLARGLFAVADAYEWSHAWSCRVAVLNSSARANKYNWYRKPTDGAQPEGILVGYELEDILCQMQSVDAKCSNPGQLIAVIDWLRKRITRVSQGVATDAMVMYIDNVCNRIKFDHTLDDAQDVVCAVFDAIAGLAQLKFWCYPLIPIIISKLLNVAGILDVEPLQGKRNMLLGVALHIFHHYVNHHNVFELDMSAALDLKALCDEGLEGALALHDAIQVQQIMKMI